MQPHERIGQAIAGANDAGRTALVPFITAGYPDPATFHRDTPVGGRRGRCRRARRAFLGPDGRRHDDPALQPQRNRKRRHTGVDLRPARGIRRPYRHAAGYDVIPEPLTRIRLRSARRACARDRRLCVHRARPPVRGVRRDSQGARGRGCWAHPAGHAGHARRSPRHARRRLTRLRLRRHDHRHHRRRRRTPCRPGRLSRQGVPSLVAARMCRVRHSHGGRRGQCRQTRAGAIVGSALVEVLERGDDPAGFLQGLR